MDLFKNRRIIILGIFLFVFIAFVLKLLHLQLIEESYKNLANQNIVRRIKLHSNRGLIFDRNKKLIVTNDAIYDLYVIPGQVKKDIDTLKFCSLLNLNTEFFATQLKNARKYSRHRPSLFVKQISIEEYARFQEYLYLFPGFYTELRTIRRYPYRGAAHTLGYIGEVNQAQITSSSFYRSGDYIGISGIEMIYEKQLRGQRGSKYILVDVFNREKGSFKDKALDTAAVSGANLHLSLDIDLQMYGEWIMQNKSGSIVAIEPQTGEILALVSSPAFDPNLLSGRERGDNFKILSSDTLHPLFNRPIMAKYPPGSTFKPVMALIGLNENTLKPTDNYKCHPGYFLGSFSVGCRPHPTVYNLSHSLELSCNAYYCHVFRNIIDQKKFSTMDESLNSWHDYVQSFGLGIKMNVDLPNEDAGLLPSPELYNRIYKNNSWKSTTIISLGIGQGELGTTPLQLANMISAIANKGYYYPPHFVTHIEGDTAESLGRYNTRHYTLVDKSKFDPVIEGLYQTVEKGTARSAKIKGIEVCGKTGTAQNPHGEDHSVFVAFAPKDNPVIAVAVFVENAGGGSKFASPIASLIIEKYLTDTISTSRKWLETKMLETDLVHHHEEE